MSWGQMIRLIVASLCRRGLLAYVYNGVSLTTVECLSGGKVALIYYGSVAMTFTVRQILRFTTQQMLFSIKAATAIDLILKQKKKTFAVL